MAWGEGEDKEGSCCASVAQLCPTLCSPVCCNPPGSSVHGILQARMLEWVAMPSSRVGRSENLFCKWATAVV